MKLNPLRSALVVFSLGMLSSWPVLSEDLVLSLRGLD